MTIYYIFSNQVFHLIRLETDGHMLANVVTNRTVSSLGNLKDSSCKFKNSWKNVINLMISRNRFEVVILILLLVLLLLLLLL
jgi:hypothetical protein